MKKFVIIVLLVLFSIGIFAQQTVYPMIINDNRHSAGQILNSLGRVDGDPITVRASAVLTYANTSETIVTPDGLSVDYTTIQAYKSYPIVIKVTYKGNISNAATLTITGYSLPYAITGAEVLDDIKSSALSSSVTITLTAAASDLDNEYYYLPESLLVGKYFYITTTFSADPVIDPWIEILTNPI